MFKKKEIEETERKVLQERHNLLDASIVRIMKLSKNISHSELVDRVFNDLKLPISVFYIFLFCYY